MVDDVAKFTMTQLLNSNDNKTLPKIVCSFSFGKRSHVLIYEEEGAHAFL